MKKLLVANTDPSIHPVTSRETDALIEIGAEIVAADCCTEEDVIALARHARVLLTAKAPVGAKAIDALSDCVAIVRYGIGVDNVDIPAATGRGILVANVPAFCIDEVADHTLSLILTHSRKLLCSDEMVRQGRWGITPLRPIQRLRGQTLGLIGLGRIGQEVARRALAFGLKAIACDPCVKPADMARIDVLAVGMDDLLSEADYVSIHLPLNEKTRHLIGREQFEKMKPSAMFINTARGAIVDESALIEALQTEKIASACLDVFETEPPHPDNPLLAMNNVLLSPHSAAYSEAAFEDLRRQGLKEALRALNGRMPTSIVNPDAKPKSQLK